MPTLKDDIRGARRTLRRLRDAFEQITGSPTNDRSQRALQMSETLREWTEEFGAANLEQSAEEHERELEESRGREQAPQPSAGTDPAREDPFIEPGAKWANEDGKVFFEVDTIAVDDTGTAWLGTFSDLWGDRGPWISVPKFRQFLEENPDAHRVE